MKKFFSALVAVAVVLPVSFLAFSAHAASATYKFTASGIVTNVNVEQKTYTIAVRNVSKTGATDLAGVNQVFAVGSAKVYKMNAAGKNIRITMKNVAVGDEVSVTGAKRANDSFGLSEVRVANKSFTVIGKVKDVDRTLKTYTITVASSTYKNSSYRNKDVIFRYSDATKFVFHSSNGPQRNADEVGENNQRVKVVGTVVNGNEWEIASFIDEFTGK